jgi:translocation and assembly module TamB
MPALFEGARLNADMTYDRGARRYTLERARMQGAAIDVDARGWTNQGEGEYSGDWRLRRMGALFGELEGQAAGRWRAVSNPPPEGQTRRVWSLSFDGAGEGIAGAPDVIPQLLGRAPQLSGLLRFEDGGVRVSHARIEGAKLRMGAEGLIVSGQSDLRVEASARGPVVLGEVRFDGAADARGRLTGSIARPALNMSAQLASMHVSGVELAQPEITLILAPDGAGVYRGTGQARALVLGQAFHAEADLGFERDAVALPRLAAELGALRARGAGRFSARGPQASLSVEGALDGLSENVSGQVRGEVTLTPEMLSLDVALDNARAGDLRLRSATISAAGPYRAIEGRVDLTGALRRAPLAFHGALALTASDNGTTLSLSGDGELAGTDFSTRTPISARFSQGSVEGGLDVAIDQGAVAGHWRERGRALSGDFTVEDAPLAPLAAIWGERAEGRIAGVGSIRSEGQGLAGALNVTLTNARVSSRSRGRLNMQVNADLSPSRFTARVEARSDGGLEARFEAEAPVETSAAPIRIALAPERRGRASWSVRGPAEALWAAARLEDQSLSGALDGEGTLSFGAGALSGSGRIGLSGGRFEDKLSGVKLEELDAEVSIGAGGVTLERFTATDSRGGRLSATGGSADPRQGRIALRMDQLRLIDRPDARARANGDLVFAWDGLDSEITGAIEFLEADVSVAQSPASVVPQLDVIEINLPNSADEFTPPAPTRMNTRLDVALTAPRRIFTRGRGLEAEWSLDLRLGGTVAAPRLTGTATAVRGEIKLSGQPFIIDTGRIMFDGAAEDARIALTAERTTSELTARISLDGTARDPDITLSSNPALPEDEILPQVLFGRSVEDLSAFEAAQLAASLAALSGQASFDLLDAARAASGLDRFAVRQDEDGGLLVAGGVYLTRDVYLEVARTGLGQAATRVEWTVRPRLVLITSFLPNGDQRASVRWRRESD